MGLARRAARKRNALPKPRHDTKPRYLSGSEILMMRKYKNRLSKIWMMRFHDLALWTAHKEFGYGRERLLKLIAKMGELTEAALDEGGRAGLIAIRDVIQDELGFYLKFKELGNEVPMEVRIHQNCGNNFLLIYLLALRDTFGFGNKRGVLAHKAYMEGHAAVLDGRLTWEQMSEDVQKLMKTEGAKVTEREFEWLLH